MKARLIAAVMLLATALPATAQADYPHVVTPGESLTSIAASDGLTVSALAQANGLSPTAQLVIGQIVQIPPQTVAVGPNPSTSNPAPAVTPVTQPAVAQATDGDIDADDTSPTTGETSGPTVAPGPATSSPPSPAPSPGPVVQTPAPQPVTGTVIAQIASQYGVPGPFAEAIAWQESGWNNAAVSPAGAVGVMQIVPGTWNWINTFLTPAAPLQSGSASDNVRGGVILLHSLLVATGGSLSQAAAAYYQGLSSVQSFGLFPSTRQYVADVLALTHRFGG